MLCFIHIPKTAGTTLHRILAQRFHKSEIAIYHDASGPLDEKITNSWVDRGIKLVMGHMSVGAHHTLPSVRYVTCLREPTARIVSHYRHARNDKQHYLHEAASAMTLEEYARSGLSGELNNCMTRMLAGMKNFHQDPVTEQTYQSALENLQTRFDAVIPSEAFNSGMLRLAEKNHWPAPYYLRRKVGHGERPEITDQALAAIREQNHWDFALHHYAMDQLQAEIGQSALHAEQLQRFEQNNRHLGMMIFLLRELRHRAGFR